MQYGQCANWQSLGVPHNGKSRYFCSSSTIGLHSFCYKMFFAPLKCNLEPIMSSLDGASDALPPLTFYTTGLQEEGAVTSRWKAQICCQSNPLNGFAVLFIKFCTNKRIEPLYNRGLLTEQYKTGLPNIWTISRIEPLSGDPLSAFDCNT